MAFTALDHLRGTTSNASRIADVLTKRQIEEAAARLKGASEESPEIYKKRITRKKRELSHLEARLLGLDNLAFSRLKEWFDTEALAGIFLNPDLMGLPFGEGGLELKEPEGLRNELTHLSARIEDDRFSGNGYRLAFSAVEPPDLAGYSDPDELRLRIQGLKREIRRNQGLLDAAQDAHAIRQDMEEKKGQAVADNIYFLTEHRDRVGQRGLLQGTGDRTA